MKQNSQLQNRIHEILERKGFYTLPFHSLIPILQLLQMEEASELKVIESNTIFGLIKWTERHQQRLQNYFIDQKYSNVALDIKLYLSSIIRTLLDQLQPSTMIENTMRNQLSYPFNPYSYINFSRFHPPPIVNNNLPFQNQYMPFPNPQMNYYRIFGGYPQIGQQTVRNSSSSIKTELQRIAAQSKRKAQMDEELPVPAQKEIKEVKEKANEAKQAKTQNVPLPLKRSKRIEGRKQRSLDDYIAKRYLQLQIPQRPKPQKKKPPQRKIKQSPLLNNPLPVPNEIEEEEKYPELQLKYYNSISDFDYKWFPPVLPKIKKTFKTVETQTSLNFIVNDFKIVDKKIETPENSKEDNQLIDEASKNEQRDQSLDIKVEQKEMFLQHASPCLFQAILQENHEEPEHIEEMEYATPQKQVSNEPNFYKCACEGKESGDWLECISCLEKYHYWCLQIEEQAVDSFECPRCRIRSIDPLVAVKDICGEYYLNNLSEQPFKASLNLSEYGFLDNAKNKNAEKMKEIELRCIKINYKDTSQNEICWPNEAVIKVNGLKTTQFYGLPKNSTVKRRKDGPIIITQSIFKYEDYDYEDIRNVCISLELKHSDKQISNSDHYLLGVYFTQKYRVEDLFQLIKGNLQLCNTNFMQNLMIIGNQQEISLQKEVFKVNDPFSGQLIELPVRGINCKHSQCFDLKTYLTLMYGLKYRTWKCPVCWRQAKKFMMDNCVSQLIQRMRLANAVAAEVNLMKDGNIIIKVIKVNKEQESSSQNQDDEEKKKSKKIKKKDKPIMIKKQDSEFESIRTFYNPPKFSQSRHESFRNKQKTPSGINLHDFP